MQTKLTRLQLLHNTVRCSVSFFFFPNNLRKFDLFDAMCAFSFSAFDARCLRNVAALACCFTFCKVFFCNFFALLINDFAVLCNLFFIFAFLYCFFKLFFALVISDFALLRNFCVIFDCRYRSFSLFFASTILLPIFFEAILAFVTSACLLFRKYVATGAYAFFNLVCNDGFAYFCGCGCMVVCACCSIWF